MKARGQPACAGYVQAIDGAKDEPETAVYTVKCRIGPQEHVGKSFHIKRGCVPKRLRPGTPIQFDVEGDESGKLVAVNVVRYRRTTTQDVAL